MRPPSARRATIISALAAIFATLTLAIPLYVIRPFRPQGTQELAFALEVRNLAPILSAICAVIALFQLIRGWGVARMPSRAALLLSSIVALSAACLTRVNIFEQMFHPYPGPAFASATETSIDTDDKLLSVTIDNQTHAFPIRTIGYHHIVNDTLAGIPIAATYCTLCHTGIVYDRRLMVDAAARTLYFTLAGINNGNALLRDRETGSIWQQSTGEAIFGPLKGRHLTLIPSDELTFALWRTERPNGLILRPDPPYIPQYDPKDWEAHIAKTHVVIDTSSTGIDPHTIVLGLAFPEQNKDLPPGLAPRDHAEAFPLQQLFAARLVRDNLYGHPLLLVVGPDNSSIRAFSPAAAMASLPHFTLATDAPGTFSDFETRSTWNFDGCAIAGPLTGECLPQVEMHKTYWFDWFKHHPDSRVFRG